MGYENMQEGTAGWNHTWVTALKASHLVHGGGAPQGELQGHHTKDVSYTKTGITLKKSE